MIGVFITFHGKALFRAFDSEEKAKEYLKMTIYTEAYMFNMMTGDLL